MKHEMIQFANEMKEMLENGKSLRQISQWSYEQRESGRNVPYMSINGKEKDGTVNHIVANPISSQKSFKAFFSTPTEGSTLDKYKLQVTFENNSAVVIFSERLGKGKDNTISLI